MSAIAKIILAIASDPEDAKKILGIVCGIAAGAIALLLLPVYLLCVVFSGAEPSDPATKNCADLAAWARRAYVIVTLTIILCVPRRDGSEINIAA